MALGVNLSTGRNWRKRTSFWSVWILASHSWQMLKQTQKFPSFSATLPRLKGWMVGMWHSEGERGHEHHGSWGGVWLQGCREQKEDHRCWLCPALLHLTCVYLNHQIILLGSEGHSSIPSAQNSCCFWSSIFSLLLSKSSWSYFYDCEEAK